MRMEIRKLLVSVVFLSLANLALSRRAKDKSLLYEKYPQLISQDTDPCIRGLNQLFINMDSNLTSDLMAFESMHGLDDLASKSAC